MLVSSLLNVMYIHHMYGSSKPYAYGACDRRHPRKAYAARVVHGFENGVRAHAQALGSELSQ